MRLDKEKGKRKKRGCRIVSHVKRDVHIQNTLQRQTFSGQNFNVLTEITSDFQYLFQISL